ncbi:hypothetical protein CU097_013969 [Rhizopus azygosporus]|uniref:EF-hand domain-containing protein n=1 Tax=Rhizopus azygosporus TaxID=86630 RepID=A0A367K3Y7_RHIAZ|nr:hypothetical protein CU097_013969 [Rhizopus azygosporus]
MSNRINQQELKSLKEAFNLYDTDHEGAIDVNKFENIVKSLGMIGTDDQRIRELIKENDSNHDGKIDFEEFVNIMNQLVSQSPLASPHETRTNQHYSKRMSRHELDELKMCFDKFDKNGDGQISEEELREVMKGLGEHLTEKEIKDMMNDADTNKDGHIDFEEFKQLMPPS